MDSPSERPPSELASYADLFQRLLDPVLILDSDSFAVIDLNDAAEKFLAEERKAILGRVLTTFVEEAGRTAFEQGLRISRRRFYPRQVESTWTMNGARRQIEAGCCMLELIDKRQVLQVVVKDVTELREVQAKASEYLNALKSANDKLHHSSITDEMTGLRNFRYFKQELAREHERAARIKSPYAVVFFDLDNFKHYNDRNGHPAGDDLLRELAKLLVQACRKGDMPARYGGEEFVVLCPDSTRDQALVLAERIRTKIEAHPFAHAEHQPLGKVSASIGVASFPQDGGSAQDIVERADQAAYASKRAGRNTVTLACNVPADVKKPSAA